MAVPENKRGLSRMKFYINAVKLRKTVLDFVSTNFGMTQNPKPYKYVNHSMDMQSMEEINQILQAYDIQNFKVKRQDFPDEYINRIKSRLLDFSEKIVDNIVAANSVFVVLNSERDLRRMHQDEAINTCFCLEEELRFIADTMKCNLHLLFECNSIIGEEVKILRGWKASDTRAYNSKKKGKGKSKENQDGVESAVDNNVDEKIIPSRNADSSKGTLDEKVSKRSELSLGYYINEVICCPELEAAVKNNRI